MPFQSRVKFVQDGEKVQAGVANRAPRQLAQNINYLQSLIDLINAGQTLVLTGRTVQEDVQVGQPVFFNSTTLRFEKALSAAEFDTSAQSIVSSASSRVSGIVQSKGTSTTADILISGVADIDLSQAVDGDVVSGPYYLSGSNAGKLQSTRPPVPIRVLEVTQPSATAGLHEVFVNPQPVDQLEQHKHIKFSLQAIPAGDHSPPSVGGDHTITNPDTSVEGWLPAANAVFDGKAPAGAKFGYNLSASALGDIWPPIPVENASLMIHRESSFKPAASLEFDFVHDFTSIPSNSSAEQAFAAAGVRVGDHVAVTADTALPADITLDYWIDSADSVTIRLSNTTGGVVDPPNTTFHAIVFPGSTAANLDIVFPTLAEVIQPDFVIINRDGIWWMSDCYNEVPWPTDLDTANPVSASISADCPTPLTSDVLLELWYTSSLFFSENFGVLSLVAAEDSGLIFRCAGTTSEQSVGHLEADLDLSLAVQDENQAGSQVIKQITGNKFLRGPVAESVRSASPEVIITSDVADTGDNGERYGNIVLTANLDLNGANFPIETVRVNGVTEEYYKDVIAIGFGQDKTAEFRGRILLPTRIALPSGTTMKLRFWVMGRASGSLGSSVFTLTRRIISRPSDPLTDVVNLPTSDTALAMTSTATFTSADQYVEMESDEFEVSSGDEVLFTMQRDAPDGYNGELFVLRQEGILVTGG